MPIFKINSQNIVGFATEASKIGDTVAKICVKMPFLTSDDPEFITLITQTTNVFINKTGYPDDFICKFLILLHKDNTAHIYINDFTEIFKAKVNRSVKKGEAIKLDDIDGIKDLRFKDIDIKNNDAIVYCTKIGWKFGMYFDFTRKLNIDKISKELGEFHNKLRFKKIEASIETTIAKADYSDSIVITEGKTDWRHLKNAKLKLNNHSKIIFHEYNEDYGDTDLIKMCEHYSRIKQGRRFIFIFDRDNEKIMKKLSEKMVSGKEYQDWGNNVYSFCLPIPSHRKKYKNISIEFFYRDKEIKTKDSKGRRVFFSNELKKEILPGGDVAMKKTKICKDVEYEKKIEDKDVSKIIGKDNKQIAISKTSFAENILNGIPDFNAFNLNEFKKVFKMIDEINKIK